MESHCYAPMSAIRRLSLSLVAPPSAVLECEEEGRTERARAEQGREPFPSRNYNYPFVSAWPNGRRVFSFLPSFLPRFPSSSRLSLFLPHHRRGSLISFLFARVAFNKLSLTSSLVQQPLCLAPVNSPAFDNRPRRAYATLSPPLFLSFLLRPPILLLHLLFHPFAFTRGAFLSSNLHFFFRDVCFSSLSSPSVVPALGGEAYVRRNERGRIPKTRNRGAGERMRVK